MIHVQPLTAIMRLYSTGSYEGRTPYDAVATLTFLDPQTVYISGLHGHMTRSLYKEMKDYFLAQGVTAVHIERHGRHKILTV